MCSLLLAASGDIMQSFMEDVGYSYHRDPLERRSPHPLQAPPQPPHFCLFSSPGNH